VAVLLVAILLVINLGLLTLKIRLLTSICSPCIIYKAVCLSQVSFNQMYSLIQDFQIEAAVLNT
jgi:hypothetical protein